ncbi:GntR family transcriptional regulator [Acrocarpospora catenulata]|uniref:GntR family transcriptional regulator n=1 Tax=Acrocarpospora catenulata TaxID=2836182 RepID=UPI0020239F70|nr:GntR family transcriptional regulator [Acrocarpospora catenulata]
MTGMGPNESTPVVLQRGRTEVSLYSQVADILAKRIENGELSPGDRVPSENEIKNEYGVAQMTARRVHRELRERGLVHTVPGEGSFVGPAETPRPEYLLPLYVQMAKEIVGDIRSGRLKPREPIPSERDLMQRHGVAKATVRMTLSTLREWGWVKTIPYRGSFVVAEDKWPAQDGGQGGRTQEVAP